MAAAPQITLMLLPHGVTDIAFGYDGARETASLIDMKARRMIKTQPGKPVGVSAMALKYLPQLAAEFHRATNCANYFFRNLYGPEADALARTFCLQLDALHAQTGLGPNVATRNLPQATGVQGSYNATTRHRLLTVRSNRGESLVIGA